MNIYPKVGYILLSKDPDINRTGLIWHPDNEVKIAQSGFVHLHNPSAEWDYAELTGWRVLYSKYAERSFKLDGKEFHVIDERDVLAVFTRSKSMTKQTFLEQVNSRLGEVEGEELSGQDLSAISEDIGQWAEDEIGLEDGEEDDEEEGDEDPAEEPATEGSDR